MVLTQLVESSAARSNVSAAALNPYRLLENLETLLFPRIDAKRLRLNFERGPEDDQSAQFDRPDGRDR